MFENLHHHMLYLPKDRRRGALRPRGATRGFTLIETLVAISILVTAIVGPMTLASQALSSAYYARDQVTAFHLAQEAVETIRNVRDSNILKNVEGTQTNLLAGIPSTGGAPFTVETRNNQMSLCGGECPPLQNNGEFYGYGNPSQWEDTRFTRTVWANGVGEGDEEVRITVEVKWQTGSFQERRVTISVNLYRWVNDSEDEE